MPKLETTLCPRCKGHGKFYRPYLPYPLICERCDGIGIIYVHPESLRTFRKRVIGGK